MRQRLETIAAFAGIGIGIALGLCALALVLLHLALSARLITAYSYAPSKNAARLTINVVTGVNHFKSHSVAPVTVTSFARAYTAREGQPSLGVSSQT